MRGKQKDIFISYRRSDGKHTARLFKSEFEKRGYRAFLDFDDLTDGKFDKRIENAILDAPIFLMILTNDYFARCNEEDDWVRKEIYCAIENERVIIPVNYDGNLNGIPDYLEPKLKNEIGLHQFSTVYADSAFEVTFDKMIKDRVEKVIKIMSDNDPQPQPQPRPKPKPVSGEFEKEFNRLYATGNFNAAFLLCLKHAKETKNVAAVKAKADLVKPNDEYVYVPASIVNVTYDWLFEKMVEKGYTGLSVEEDCILWFTSAGTRKITIDKDNGKGYLINVGMTRSARISDFTCRILCLSIVGIPLCISDIISNNKNRKRLVNDIIDFCWEECEN